MSQRVDGGMIIRKQTMILKNLKPLDEVYTMEKKTLGKGTYGEVRAGVHKASG